jgi:dTDP-4-dehydrorhamnose reductase
MKQRAERVAVLGGRGMLGTDLCAALRASGWPVVAFDLPECDITRPEQLEPALGGVGAVVNCAAYTNVDGAEAHRELADAVNHVAVGELGRLAAARGLYVLHIGTDFVFDGELDRPYRETDAARPLSVYGATKLAGEQALAASGCTHAVVRVQWTYGRAGQHFVAKILAKAATTDELAVVADQVGSPTWTQDVAGALCELLEQRAQGLFHYAAQGYASRYEVAQAILEVRGLTGKRLRPCRTADFRAAARRPLNSRFDCTRIETLLSQPRPHWRQALARFLAGG